jgi:hypothetical protein
MSHSLADSTDLRRLYPEALWLEPEHFDQASQLSNQVTGEANQWQTYLNMLALLGFVQWLGERVGDVTINWQNCSVLQPKYANVIEAVCNLKICDFTLCLIATENSDDELVSVPRAAIDLPEFVAHFYVLIEVQEEQEQVIIRGLLRYEELIHYQQSVNLKTKPDWSYQLPLSLFDDEPNHLLFYLRFLQPQAIALPLGTNNGLTQSWLTQAELEALLSNLQSPEHRLWQSLTWEQGAIILTCPELLDLLYQWQTKPKETALLSIRIREVFTLLIAKAVNAARWLQGEMDEVAASLGLFFTGAAPVFRAMPQFEAAIAQLKQQGMAIPPQAGRTYQDINLEEISLRLCALTWSGASQLPSRKWSLLLILGTQMGEPLPDELKLQVSNLTGILREAISELDDQFLFAHVEGDWGEKFVATIVPSDRSSLTLPAYTFETEQAL